MSSGNGCKLEFSKDNYEILKKRLSQVPDNSDWITVISDLVRDIWELSYHDYRCCPKLGGEECYANCKSNAILPKIICIHLRPHDSDYNRNYWKSALTDR